MNKKVLIVEDEEDVAQAMCDRIESWGLETAVAATGRAGLEMLDQIHPDIVLLDIRLPDRNGLDVLRDIRQRSADLPIFVVTASHGSDIEPRAREAGANEYILKPYHPGELRRKIFKAIGLGTTDSAESEQSPGTHPG